MAREEGIERATGERGTGVAPVIWTPSQRQTLLVLVSLFLIVLSMKAIRNRQYVPNPQPNQPPLADQLSTRIDPNTATAAELMVLPQLGEKRAADIIAFRQRRSRHDPSRPPFQRPEDLMQIKGVGPALVETLRPHLTFSTTAPAAHIIPAE